MEHPFLMFLDHTQRRSTIGIVPVVLDNIFLVNTVQTIEYFEYMIWSREVR